MSEISENTSCDSVSTRYDAIVIDNSPIEFILFGPRRNADGILVRTRNAGLELIGLASDEMASEGTRSSPYNALSLLGLNYHPECSRVQTTPTNVNKISDDKRLGTFTFAWFGASSSGDLERIQKEFNRRAADLQSATANRDREQVEWFLGPVAALCAQAHRRQRWYRNFMRFTIIFYIIFLLIIFGWRFVSRLLGLPT
jgi:hypothetical protein